MPVAVEQEERCGGNDTHHYQSAPQKFIGARFAGCLQQRARRKIAHQDAHTNDGVVEPIMSRHESAAGQRYDRVHLKWEYCR